MNNSSIHVGHTSRDRQKDERRYIFWCYSDMPGMLDILFHRESGIIVEIDNQKLEYASNHEKKYILLKDVKDASFQEFGAGEDTFPMVTIIARDNLRVDFYPLNPLNPNSPLSGMKEAAAMVQIIKALRKGETIELDPNPYHRELIRQGRMDEISQRYWDSYVSPWVYYAQKHPHFHSPLRMILLAIIPGLILIAIGLILNYFQ